MKFGTYTFAHESLPLEARLQAIRAAGFDFVALDSTELENGIPLCEKLGIPIENVHLNSRSTSKICFWYKIKYRWKCIYCRR